MRKSCVKFSNMLATSFHSDPLDTCRQILGRYWPDSASATIVPRTHSVGFSGAAIYRVEYDRREYCLRRWPLLAPEPRRLTGLHRLLAFTAARGISQVPVPLQTSSGQTLLRADGHWWQLEPWMPGKADFHALPNRTRLQSAMQTLAAWHLAARQFTPQAEEVAWFFHAESAVSPGLTERWKLLSHWHDRGEAVFRPLLQTYPDFELREILSRIWNHVRNVEPATTSKLAGLLGRPAPLQPCLRDVWHDHLLFTGDRLSGLIDAAACRSDCVVTDLARVLGSLVEDDRIEWEFALDSYQAVRPLSLTELSLLPAFDESAVVLSGLTWLDWLLVQKRVFAERTHVKERLEGVARRLERR